MGQVKKLRNKKKKKRSTRSGERTPRKRREIWQAAIVRMPLWVDEPDDPPAYRPLNAMAISLTQGFLGMSEIRPRGQYHREQLFEALDMLGAFCSRGPDAIEICDPELEPVLRQSPGFEDVEIIHRPVLAGLDSVLDKFAIDTTRDVLSIPNILTIQGLKAEDIRAFAAAFEVFFSTAVWEILDSTNIIRIESRIPDPSVRYLTVLGAGGEEFGIGLAESHDVLADLGEVPLVDLLRTSSLWSVSLFEARALHYREHDFWDNEGLPVFNNGQIPAAVRFGPRDRLRRAGPKTLAFITALLEALAATTVEDLKQVSWSRTVTTRTGKMTLEFTLLG